MSVRLQPDQERPPDGGHDRHSSIPDDDGVSGRRSG
jgi:hypothetical protein